MGELIGILGVQAGMDTMVKLVAFGIWAQVAVGAFIAVQIGRLVSVWQQWSRATRSGS